MKIALVVHDYHRSGGHSRYVVELAERFSRDNEVHVFTNTFSEEAHSPIRFHHVRAWRYSALTTILSFLPGTKGIGRQFDIVHAQGACSLQADVITTHICNSAWFDARRRFEKNLSIKEYVFNAAISPLERLIYSSPAPRVIAVSKRVQQDLAAYYRRTAKVDVVYHGVDAARFSPAASAASRGTARAAFGLGELDFVFLFVGDLRKGAVVTIQALTRVPNAKLLCVSRTPPDSYLKLARQAGVADRVVIGAFDPRIELAYAASDAFAFPTPYDAFGMVIAEAMASGLPVITSKEAGASEWISHQSNGLLLNNPADQAELAGHMLRLTGDPATCRRLGHAARETAEQYGWNFVAERTMQIYQTAIAERRS